MSTRLQLCQQVEKRAGGCCEYCRMHQSLQGATFHVEHVVPLSLQGADKLENLAWACPSCNLHKSNRTQAVDSETGVQVSLFHPRQHDWNEHFLWDEYAIEGRTSNGRATVVALQLNHVRRLQIRQVEQRLGLFPPSDSTDSK